MRSLLLLLALFFCGEMTVTAQALSKKSTHQAILTEGIKTVRFNIDPANIEVRSTRSTRVLVETSVTMNGSPALLDYAISTGRYNLEAITTGDILTVGEAANKQTIVIRGETIVETVTYVLYIPEHLEQKVPATTIAAD